MIDLEDPNEMLLTSEGAAEWLAERGAGRVCSRTIWRWISAGIRVGGRTVRLESCKLGGFRYTSTGALARFIAAQSESSSDPAPKPPACSPEAERAEIRAYLDAIV